MSVETADVVDVEVLHARVDRLVGFDSSSASLADLDGLSPDLNAMAGWVASLRAGFAGRRAALIADAAEAGGPLPDHGDPNEGHRRRSKQSQRASARDLERQRTLALFPRLRQALVDGVIDVEHVDILTAARKDLTVAQRLSLVELDGEITVLAVGHPPEPFRTALHRLVARLVADDGRTRFERQRRNTRLRVWTDPDTGMVRLFGEFDPERGAHLANLLRHAVDAMYALPVPAGCPDDPVAKNDHLRALALLQLVQQGTISEAGTTGPDVDLVVVVDHDTLCAGVHDQTILDAGPGIHLPVATLRRMACTAQIIPVVLNGDGVALDVGRSQHVANRAQRRALRAMYPTCAIQGCSTRFEHCQIHHVAWWGRDLGPTNLANLVPLCSKHHHAVHEGGWQITINPKTRELTVKFPDGDVLVIPPPRAGWNGTPKRGDPTRRPDPASHPEPEPENPPNPTLWAS
jgi:hypothetical protein